jgi:DNA replication and repair protein RecF
VFFSPTDVDLIAGSPSVRRRYLDVMLCQVDPAYFRALNRYNRALLQRNSLLRQVRDGLQPAQGLDYWDSQITEHGAVVIALRASAVRDLAVVAASSHADLSSGIENLSVRYKPALPQADVSDDVLSGVALASHFVLKTTIESLRSREIAAGMSLAGPHRDDLSFTVNDVDVTAFGSRGQQRTATLALKLAELEYMRAHAGEQPVLLLDDAMSELDERRRHAILAVASAGQQTFVTSADATVFTELSRATQRWSVEAGTLRPVA